MSSRLTYPESGPAGPASSGWFIESMHDFESVRMSALERVELVTKQDIGFSNVGIEQSESRSVCRIIERVVHEVVYPPPINATSSNSFARMGWTTDR